MDSSSATSARLEGSNPAKYIDLDSTFKDGGDSGGDDVGTGAALNETNVTGGIPPPEVTNPAGVGQPQSLPEHGISLTTPVEVKSDHRRTASAGASERLVQELFEFPRKGRSARIESLTKKRSSGGRDSSSGVCSSETFDDVLGSRHLLKDVRGRSSPVTSEREGLEEETVSLKRVPSYRNSKSDIGRNRNQRSVFEPERRRTTILSMDGGGMRGLIAARCLAHLESLLQSKTGGEVKLCEYFDFLAGTSTGAILTLMISTPDANGNPLFDGQGCCQFYARNGRDIFRPRWFDPWRGTIRQLYRPKYSPRRFEKLLKSYLIRDGRALTMRDTLKPFLVTSFDISRATPHIFVRQAAMKDDSRNFRLWEVCRGTASAPTYFRPAEVSSIDGNHKTTLIDGGAIQNNPALVALTHVLGNNEEFPEAVGLQDVLILSLGAGQLDEKFDLKKAKKWGLAGWMRPLLNILMDGSSVDSSMEYQPTRMLVSFADTIDYQLAAGFAGHSCSENYLRIQLSGLPNETSLMDCATKENIQDLVQVTDDLLQQKAVMRNEYGEKVVHSETYAERLSWFADQLIHQKTLREQKPLSNGPPKLLNRPEVGLHPTNKIVSPMFAQLFMHHQLHPHGPSRRLETAKSVRF